MACIMPGCRRSNRPRPKGVSFHLFPTEKHGLELWKESLGMSGVPLHPRACICSVHFPEHHILHVANRHILIANALPDKNIKYHPYRKEDDPFGLASSDDEYKYGPSRRQQRMIGQETVVHHEEPKRRKRLSAPLIQTDDGYSRTSYLIPLKYVSPDPIWHMRSYMPGERTITAVPFTSVISRGTQTEGEADAVPETEQPKPEEPKLQKDHYIDPLTVVVHRNEAILSVAMQKARLKVSKFNRLINKKDKGIKYLLGSLDRADQRMEGLAKLIEDLTPVGEVGKRKRRKRKPRSAPWNEIVPDESQTHTDGGDVGNVIVPAICLASAPGAEDVQIFVNGVAINANHLTASQVV